MKLRVSYTRIGAVENKSSWICSAIKSENYCDREQQPGGFLQFFRGGPSGGDPSWFFVRRSIAGREGFAEEVMVSLGASGEGFQGLSDARQSQTDFLRIYIVFSGLQNETGKENLSLWRKMCALLEMWFITVLLFIIVGLCG